MMCILRHLSSVLATKINTKSELYNNGEGGSCPPSPPLPLVPIKRVVASVQSVLWLQLCVVKDTNYSLYGTDYNAATIVALIKALLELDVLWIHAHPCVQWRHWGGACGFICTHSIYYHCTFNSMFT